MAPDILWINMKSKKCLLATCRVHVANCQAKVCSKSGHRKICPIAAAPGSSACTNVHKQSRSASSMPESCWLGLLSEVEYGMAMVLLPFV